MCGKGFGAQLQSVLVSRKSFQPGSKIFLLNDLSFSSGQYKLVV